MATIESYVKPKRLYRYRSLENLEQEIEAIREGYLFCAAYDQLNDPMEGRFVPSKLLKRSAKYRAIVDEIADEKAATGVCSFSEVSNHELMWAHYSDHFKGICVAYSLSRLEQNLADSVSFVRMYYDESAPTVGRSRAPRSQLARMVLSHKNYRWLYEREWRMFARRGEVHYSNTACVTRVYLGYRMMPSHRHQITAALEPLKIGTSNMLVDKYSIRFGPKSQY